jgi:cytochrome c peroxidase
MTGHLLRASIALAAVATAVAAAAAGAWWAARSGVPPVPALATLPPVPVPADNPMSAAKVELGRLLFFDPRLSGNGSTSCASCHVAQMGWTHHDPLAPGYPGHRLWRNNPTVLNAAHFRRLMWDGSLDRLEVQARSAMQAPVEGNGKATVVEMRLRLVPDYVERFRDVFGTDWPQLEHAWHAIAAFERTVVSDPRRVPFDRFLAGDDLSLSASAKRGYALFAGKAGCIACHHGPLASDEGYHSLGVPRQSLLDSSPLVQIAVRWQNAQRDAPRALYRDAEEDLGRYYRTRDPGDIGKFRTPSLRELRYTAPYMHNGVFATLQEVVEFFDRGGGDAPNKSPLLSPLGLSGDEKHDLVAFLESMSMDEPLVVEAPELPPMLPLADGQAGECTADAPAPGPFATAASAGMQGRQRGSPR